MPIKQPKPDKSKKDFTIEKIDGVQRVWVAGYPVRYYAPPAENDYLARMKLIRGFTQSFFRLAEPGIEMPAESLNELRRRFDATLDDAPDKRIRGAFLLGAIFAKIEKTIEGLIEKNHGSPSPEAIPKDVEESLSIEMEEAYELIRRYVRRRGPTREIEKDDDEVLDRAFGESIKLLSWTMEQIYQHRYGRIAGAQRAIDKVADSMKGVADRYPALQPMIPMIEEMANLCKARSDVMREDIYSNWLVSEEVEHAPDYVEIAVAFDVMRDRTRDFKPELPPHLPEGLAADSNAALELIKDGLSLMRDMARVRVDRPESVEAILKKAKEITTSRSGDGPWRVAG